MKNLHVLIEDELFDRLGKLMTHRGERTHYLRMAVRNLVNSLELAAKKKEGEDGYNQTIKGEGKELA